MSSQPRTFAADGLVDRLTCLLHAHTHFSSYLAASSPRKDVSQAMAQRPMFAKISQRVKNLHLLRDEMPMRDVRKARLVRSAPIPGIILL